MKFFISILAICCLLLLSACTTTLNGISSKGQNLDRARFEAYRIKIVAQDASQGYCDYGPLRLAEFKTISQGDSIGGGGTIGLREIFPELKCHWIAGDGSAREEIVPAQKFLPSKILEWEPVQGKLYIDEPLEPHTAPEFRIDIKNKLFRITRKFKIQLYGEQLAERSWRIRTAEVKQIIYEHE